jgi:hypothetical protein
VVAVAGGQQRLERNPSTPRSSMSSTSRFSTVGSPSVSPTNSRWLWISAVETLPRIISPANGSVATVSETSPIVWVKFVRRLRAIRLGR